MKKLFLFLVLSFFAISVIAQNIFQNPGFETWSNSLPNNWNTLSAPFIGNISDITKTTDYHSGSFAVRIASKRMLVPIEGFSIAPGFLTNATVNLMGLAQIPFSDSIDLSLLASVLTNGMQLTEKPTAVSGYYSWNPIDSDNESFQFVSLVISDNSGTREVIGVGFVGPNTPFKSTYVSFESEIMYLDPLAIPTELIFIALTNTTDSNATIFGHLLLDDVSLTTEVGIEKITNNTKSPTIIYPNPTNGDFKLNVKSKVEVSVYNQLGQVVISPIIYNPNKTISVKEKGIYYVRIKDSNGTKTQKLIVK